MTFLGRPRDAAAETAEEVDRYSLSAMFILAALCLLAGILPGLVIDALSPVTLQILGGRMPIQANVPWLSIVPIAESRSSYNGLLVMVFIAISASSAVVFIHRFASRALRRGPAWDCGFSDPTPAAQYSGGASLSLFAAFSVRSCSTPAKCRDAGARRYQAGAAAIELHDLVWEGMYAPIAGAVGFHRSAQPPAVPDHPALSQAVFATLVTLLLVLAIWS